MSDVPKTPPSGPQRGRPKGKKREQQVTNYAHPEAQIASRPDIGVQREFKKKKPPATYRYDSSFSPRLQWDENAARVEGEALLAEVALHAKRLKDAKGESECNVAIAAIEAATQKLQALGKPFLEWTGKVEHSALAVPTLPLFVHERLSTKAIIETIADHKRDTQQSLFDLFGDPERSVTDQILHAYEHRDNWVNRLILGDSLIVMNSLLHYERLGGQVQMIYMDPPYGVKFGSNFQPFIRKRDVEHGDDEHISREPEVVQAYRDTWECGVHSYLTYLRDRLFLVKDLLHPTGSIFVQISDENLHHIREIMDEVFGVENFMSVITYRVKSPLSVKFLGRSSDFIIWYAKNKELMKYRQPYVPKLQSEQPEFNMVELPDGKRMSLSACIEEFGSVPSGVRYFTAQNLGSSGYTASCMYDFEVNGKKYSPPRGKSWKTNFEGMSKLLEKRRLIALPNSLRFVYYLDDFPVQELSNMWGDTFAEGDKLYVVQTAELVVQRCILMTTDPGDLVVDPTCGSGTTAYVAEQWGRRWITMDTSRVPLALARQRLLTATFPYYQLRDEKSGVSGGFHYERRQNKKGEEVGGIVPHVTLKCIANNDPPEEEVLTDRPEEVNGFTRVTGPFCIEATIPTPVDWEGDGTEDSGMKDGEERAEFIDRMIEILRSSPVLRLPGNKTVTFESIRKPTKSLVLSAEGVVRNAEQKPVAFLFGPQNAAVSEVMVMHAAREACDKEYTHLYVMGFSVEPNAKRLINECGEAIGIGATYMAATMDLNMADLLKNTRSSQIFSVHGEPDIAIEKSKDGKYRVTLRGLDVFDPITMDPDHRSGSDVPAWLLDTNYNDLCFHVCQAFFPRTSAWENLKRALKGTYDDAVWEHLAGNVSTPFPAGSHNKIAVKVIDDRGNELMVVRPLP